MLDTCNIEDNTDGGNSAIIEGVCSQIEEAIEGLDPGALCAVYWAGKGDRAAVAAGLPLEGPLAPGAHHRALPHCHTAAPTLSALHHCTNSRCHTAALTLTASQHKPYLRVQLHNVTLTSQGLEASPPGGCYPLFSQLKPVWLLRAWCTPRLTK